MQDPAPERPLPLHGLRVVDMSRLAPGPYATMLLADLGAEVIAVGGGRSSEAISVFMRGKTAIALDLKGEAGRQALHTLVASADVFVEGFRPGAAARLGADYGTLSALNPALVYCSLTGYGQSGPRAGDAGHDINYLAIGGALGAFGEPDRPPRAPLNLVADFAGGSIVAAFSILAAAIEARATGQGRHLDVAMIDGVRSLMAMHLPLWNTIHNPARGEGLLAGSMPFYRTYPCACGGFVAVGALERPFFVALWTALGLGEAPDHMKRANWPAIEERLAEAFLTKSRDAWSEHFIGTDACVTPVLAPDEFSGDPHNAARHAGLGADTVPVLPALDPQILPRGFDPEDDATDRVLAALGLDAATIAAARAPKGPGASGMAWPPELS